MNDMKAAFGTVSHDGGLYGITYYREATGRGCYSTGSLTGYGPDVFEKYGFKGMPIIRFDRADLHAVCEHLHMPLPIETSSPSEYVRHVPMADYLAGCVKAGIPVDVQE